MSRPRTTIIDQFRMPFWGYHSLRPSMNRLLLIVVAIILIADSLVRATSGTDTTLLRAIVSTAMIIVIALFAWRPPVATVGMILVVVISAITGSASDYLIGVVLVVGLVATTCSAALSAVFIAVVFSWLIVEVLRPSSGLEIAGAVIVTLLGVASLFIGLTTRQQADRWRKLSAQVEETEREVAEQLKRERDLIADELHDIVAHEITIVALHAAVLERTEDPSTRDQSQTAIREASVQALTDIRRVLGMVRGEETLPPERVPSPDTLEATIDAIIPEMHNAGIDVEVQLPDDLRVSSAALVALTRVVRESATNVLKHATGATRVRIEVGVAHEWVNLEFADNSPPAQTAGLPSSGYGIMRLQERFRLFGGTFAAERRHNEWVVTASLPLTA